jgi:hypothetical protein
MRVTNIYVSNTNVSILHGIIANHVGRGPDVFALPAPGFSTS